MTNWIIVGIVIIFLVLSLSFVKILYKKINTPSQVELHESEDTSKKYQHIIVLIILMPLYVAWKVARFLLNESFTKYLDPIIKLVRSNFFIFFYLYISIFSFLILQFNLGSSFLNNISIMTLLLFSVLFLDALLSKNQFSLNESLMLQIIFITLLVLIGYMYFFGFYAELLNSQSFDFMMFFISLFFLNASLFLIIKINSFLSKINIFVILFTGIHAVGIAFFSYTLIGYGMAYFDYASDLSNLEVNVYPYDGFNSLVAIAYYGITSLTDMPDILFSQEDISENHMIPIESIQLRLIALAYTTVYTVLILSYFSNILFKRNVKNRAE